MLMKMRDNMRRSENQKGFTLVELMVVVVIIGILIGIAVPVYRTAQARAQQRTCNANQRMIDSAIMQWQLEPGNEGQYPPDLATLSTYFQETPVCPTNNAYVLPNSAGAHTTCPAHPRT